MSFPLGKPILAMLIVALSGAAAFIAWPQHRSRAELRIWTFADSHARSYNAVLPQYRREHNASVDLFTVGYRALNLRLGTMFMSGQRLEDSPDIAEVEIGAIGQFFRPPVHEVGFLPLNDFLENNGAREIRSVDDPGKKGQNARLAGSQQIYTHDGTRWVLNSSRTKPDMWIDRIVRTRTAPWSKEGRIFGVPHDVHPCVIAYRQDLFQEAGVDLEAPRTWGEFQEACLRFQEYWRQHGQPYRHALELPEASSDRVQLMLNQQQINPIDDRDQLHITEDKVVKTIAFYAQLVAGPRAIAGESSPGTGSFTQDLVQGNLAAYIVADWRLNDLRVYGGDKIKGKVRLRPLPVFDIASDVPTATWGGTMMGILKTSPNPQKAWNVVEFLYFSPEAMEARRKETDILPPMKDLWDDPHYHQPDEFFGGQMVNELFIDLAEKIPLRYNSPATPIVGQRLTFIVSDAVRYVASRGTDGLEDAIRSWLADAQTDLTRRIEHIRVESEPTAQARGGER